MSTPRFHNNDEDWIFANYRMLTPDYDPPRIIGREQQIKEIVGVLSSGYRYGHASNAIIFGQTGTGRSLVVHHVVQDFLDSVKKAGKYNFKAVFLDPGLRKRGTWSSAMILRSILQEIAPDIEVKKSGVITDHYWRVLCNHMNKEKLSLVLIIKEPEKILANAIIYPFTRAVEHKDLDSGNQIALLMISNDFQYENSLHSRDISTLMASKFRFPVYNTDQIRMILEDRREAFRAGVLSEEVISKCAAIIANQYGDAHTGIELLRWAGLLAQKEGSTTVETRHVDLAMNVIEIDGNVKMLNDYPLSVRKVFEAIATAVRDQPLRETTVASIIATYRKIWEVADKTPVGERRIFQIIDELDDLGLVSETENRTGQDVERLVTFQADPKIVLARLAGIDTWR
jgi:archaeal cell division control protein 6